MPSPRLTLALTLAVTFSAAILCVSTLAPITAAAAPFPAVAATVTASAITATEAFADRPAGPSVDHSQWDRLLQSIVTDDGMIDYDLLLREHRRDLDAYLARLGTVDLDALPRDQMLALLINAYNAFTLKLIVDHWPVDSIMDIPRQERWDAQRWNLGGRTLSLNQIEHQWLRQKFVEPRIHFAINCASVGCPPVLDRAYVAGRIDAQLEEVTRAVHENGSRWFQFDPGASVVKLTKLYEWYGEDFEQVAASPLDFVARYSPVLKASLDAGRQPRIEWLPYDWSLNRGEKRPPDKPSANRG